jgi:hypothetical protein
MKRILMMLALAAFLVAALSVSALSAFADPNCAKVGDNNKNCKVEGPGGSENSQGQAAEHNPNFTTTFHGRPQ